MNKNVKKCIICNGDTKQIEFKTDKCVSSDARFIDTPLSHSYCECCGYVFVDFDKRVDYEKFYNDEYEFLLDGDIEPVLQSNKYSDMLVAFLDIKTPDGNFLDIGAGKGNFLDAVHSRFKNLELYGLEPSKAYEILKQKTYLKQSYNNFFNSNDFNATFDYISMIGVLEHVHNPKNFLNDVCKIMHDDTFLLIEVPNFQNNKADLLTVDHLSKFTEGSIENLLSVAGLEIIKKKCSKAVPMQYIVKKMVNSNSQIVYKFNILEYIEKSSMYLKNIINNTTLKKKKIAVYGQGLILEYLLGTSRLKIENIACVIDDNVLYQAKKYKKRVPIVSFDEFHVSEKYKNIKIILLCMNECYHELVIDKISQFQVEGCLN